MGSSDEQKDDHVELPPGIGVYPGWTAKQTVQFRSLLERYDGVARAYGQTLRPPNVTPEQAQDCVRFVSGESALPATLANLKAIEKNPALDATAKAEAAQKEFANVAALDGFVRGVQQRCNITDNGVRLLPLLDERGSEVYGNLYHHVTHRLADVDRVLAQKDPVFTYPPAALERASALTQVGMRLDDLPDRLEKLAAGDYTPEQKSDMALEHLRQFASASQSVYSVERDLQNYDNAVSHERLSPTRLSFLSKSWSRVKDVASGMWDKAFGRSEERELKPEKLAALEAKELAAAEQRYGRAADLEIGTPVMENKLPFEPAVKYETAGPMEETWRSTGMVGFDIEAGEAGHEHPKGLGFSASGKVDEIHHVEGKVELDYTVHGHHQSIRVEDGDPLAKAVTDLHPGDDFKFSVSRDAKGREVADVEDRTTHHGVRVHDDGRAEEKQVEDRGLERKTQTR